MKAAVRPQFALSSFMRSPAGGLIIIVCMTPRPEPRPTPCARANDAKDLNEKIIREMNQQRAVAGR